MKNMNELPHLTPDSISFNSLEEECKHDKPLVVVRCITYNHESYIRECLDGFIMQQTNFKFIVIIHDDASTDGTPAIIKEYADKYPHIIKPIYQVQNQYSKKNGSITRILANACNKTGAKYIAFCEGDDYWIDPLKLQRQVDYMNRNPKCGLSYTNFNIRHEPSGLVESGIFSSANPPIVNFESHLKTSGYIAPMSWLCRTDTWNKIENWEAPFIIKDQTFVYALLFFAESDVRYIDSITSVYRVHRGSASKPTLRSDQHQYDRNIFEIQKYFHHTYHLDDSVLISIKSRFYTANWINVLSYGTPEEIKELSTYFGKTDYPPIKGLMVRIFMKIPISRHLIKKYYIRTCR